MFLEGLKMQDFADWFSFVKILLSLSVFKSPGFSWAKLYYPCIKHLIDHIKLYICLKPNTSFCIST